MRRRIPALEIIRLPLLIREVIFNCTRHCSRAEIEIGIGCHVHTIDDRVVERLGDRPVQCPVKAHGTIPDREIIHAHFFARELIVDLHE